MADDATIGPPLPGSPDPWAPAGMPTLRAGPPYVMAEMIAAEPALAERLLRRMAAGTALAEVAALVAEAAARGEPITTTGCGTSEHAAMALAALLADALPRGRAHLVRSRQALDLMREPQAAGVVLGISHDGGTSATNGAVAGSRAAGARTAIITVSPRSPAAGAAEIVIETGELDQSWCHTVGYLSPVVAGAALAGLVRGEALDPIAVRALLTIGLGEESAAAEVAAALARCRRLLVAGAGGDLVSARELALKVEEGSGIPATAWHLETVRHGHLAAADETAGLVLILTDAEPDGAPVRQRAARVLRAARALAMPAAGILGARLGTEIPQDLTPAGRLIAAEANAMPPLPEALIGCAVPLQLLALELAMARGRNPDAIGRDDPAHAAAATT